MVSVPLVILWRYLVVGDAIGSHYHLVSNLDIKQSSHIYIFLYEVLGFVVFRIIFNHHV